MNLQHIQLLRNSSIAATKDAAVTLMRQKAQELSDGTPILGRYNVTEGNTTTVHTLLGLVHNSGTTAGTLTILADTYDIADLDSKISSAKTADKVTLESADSSENGVLKTYTIKQGEIPVGTINIPKDFLVKSGSLVKGTFADGGNGAFTEAENGADTAIKLVINAQDGNDTESNIYINVQDLIDIYTGSTGDTVNVTVEGKTIKASLSESAQTRVNNALTGVTVNGQTATPTNNVAVVTVDASQIQFSTGYTPNDHGVVATGKTIEENVKALEQAVLDNETTLAASDNRLNDTKIESIKITGGTVNGGEEMPSGKTASIVINGGTVKVSSTTEATGTIAVGDTIDTALAKLNNTVAANATKQKLSSANGSITVASSDAGTTADVHVDGKSIKIDTADGDGKGQLYIDTIDGGTY